MVHTIFKWLEHLFLIALGAFLLALCGFLSYFSLIWGSGERLSKAVAPPEYPNSELIEQWKSGGPTTMWDRRTYHTNDDIDTVLSFYEDHMPGFTKSDYSGDSEITYRNGKCSESKLAHHIASIVEDNEFGDDSNLPCVSVTLISDSEQNAGTQINIWFDWPAP